MNKWIARAVRLCVVLLAFAAAVPTSPPAFVSPRKSYALQRSQSDHRAYLPLVQGNCRPMSFSAPGATRSAGLPTPGALPSVEIESMWRTQGTTGYRCLICTASPWRCLGNRACRGAVLRSLWHRGGRERDRLRGGHGQRSHPGLHLRGDVPAPVGEQGQRSRAVRLSLWHRGGRERDRLRGGHGQPPHPGLHLRGDVPAPVGEPGQRSRAVRLSLWHRGGRRSGTVYVADTGNHRIQAFTAEGTFLRQWGS